MKSVSVRKLQLAYQFAGGEGLVLVFYSIGCATGAIVSTLVYARAGWSGVCALGAATSALALLFWVLTLRFTPEARSPILSRHPNQEQQM